MITYIKTFQTVMHKDRKDIPKALVCTSRIFLFGIRIYQRRRIYKNFNYVTDFNNSKTYIFPISPEMA